MQRLAQSFYTWRLRQSGVELAGIVTLYGMPLVNRHKGSSIRLGERVVLCSDPRFTALALNHAVKLLTTTPEACLHIGADTGISGACIVSANCVDIGNDVLLGANVTIIDTDFHPIAPAGRRHSDDRSAIGTAPVVICDNVFVGAGSIILKGVRIGRDSVVGAGSVVPAGDYPQGSILAGNPAKIIGTVYKERIA